MIGTVMTRCVITSAVSVLLRRRNWKTAKSGIRYESAGVIRAIRISTMSRFAPSARDPEAGGNADQQRGQRRAAGDDDAVPQVAPDRILLEHLQEIVERRRIGDEHRRIGEIVDLVLERQRQHPEEHEHGRRYDDQHRQPEAGLAQPRDCARGRCAGRASCRIAALRSIWSFPARAGAAGRAPAR